LKFIVDMVGIVRSNTPSCHREQASEQSRLSLVCHWPDRSQQYLNAQFILCAFKSGIRLPLSTNQHLPHSSSKGIQESDRSWSCTLKTAPSLAFILQDSGSRVSSASRSCAQIGPLIIGSVCRFLVYGSKNQHRGLKYNTSLTKTDAQQSCLSVGLGTPAGKPLERRELGRSQI
jgi:hypothetical protein